MHARTPAAPARHRAAAVVLALLAGAACGPDAAPEAPASDPSAGPAPAAPAQAAAPGGPRPGRYGCAETVPRMVGGAYQFESEGRGFVAVRASGAYADPAGVEGAYAHDAATGETRFRGGALDGAVATPMEDEPDRYRVVIPAESGERRWSCSRT